MPKIRINKFIASSGICSRREADEYIENGKVKVNGKTVKEPGFSVDDKKDKVEVDGKLIKPVKLDYYKFYKPAGYITTSDDEKGRKTIYDLLPENLYHLKPVGRLDKDSTGLIILTNDGELINQLTHPSVKIPKIYLVRVDKKIPRKDLELISQGVEIEKGKIAYADITVLEMDSESTTMRITLFQGMNRQIRKMFEHFGYEVKSLKRIQHATITLDGMKRGEFKQLKPKNVKELKSYLSKAQNND
ncbi:rRNA pseudouridine synthase [bacterium]|nr:rRNA pseudouridine synthase [bacterium]